MKTFYCIVYTNKGTFVTDRREMDEAEQEALISMLTTDRKFTHLQFDLEDGSTLILRGEDADNCSFQIFNED